MTGTQYIRLFDFFKENMHIDDAKAKVFVEEVEKIVEDKFDQQKENFSLRSDIQEIKYQIELLRQEMKAAMAESKSEIRAEINKIIIWTVSTGLAVVGLLLAFLKL